MIQKGGAGCGEYENGGHVGVIAGGFLGGREEAESEVLAGEILAEVLESKRMVKSKESRPGQVFSMKHLVTRSSRDAWRV